ncbi:HAD hydrolase family protein [Pseudoflavitalea sp. X16]|uniref:KdsC family phosphatase n=1 Tax=Paraflavitalea devenefica TaxID=2716334 RepID=UPI00141E5A80|nr:HAD hydrolase family protein [Paraflavitalea devenefica]NII29552.1 HAD hydrolase family protein [Paraflavitalea devenefica]
MRLPKLVITDIDGVWTDGSMYYDNTGNEFKRFNTYDSAGVVFCEKAGIEVAIISGENSQATLNRAAKLGIKKVFVGIKDKLSVAEQLIKELGITFDDVAYIGDDINDVEVLKKVPLSASPANAPDYIKDITTFVTSKSGGQGAFREFIETILQENNLLEEILNTYGL